MIVISKGVLNIFTLTLRELADLTKPMEWVLKFELEQSPEDYNYTVELPDISTNSDYQTFELTEGSDVTFQFLGDYKYTAFQKDGMKVVEVGKMRVIETPEQNPTFEADNTRKIYDNDN